MPLAPNFFPPPPPFSVFHQRYIHTFKPSTLVCIMKRKPATSFRQGRFPLQKKSVAKFLPCSDTNGNSNIES